MIYQILPQERGSISSVERKILVGKSTYNVRKHALFENILYLNLQEELHFLNKRCVLNRLLFNTAYDHLPFKAPEIKFLVGRTIDSIYLCIVSKSKIKLTKKSSQTCSSVFE